jgi:hypothetical protein
MTADLPQEPAANSVSRPPMHIASNQQAPTRLGGCQNSGLHLLSLNTHSSRSLCQVS